MLDSNTAFATTKLQAEEKYKPGPIEGDDLVAGGGLSDFLIAIEYMFTFARKASFIVFGVR